MNNSLFSISCNTLSALLCVIPTIVSAEINTNLCIQCQMIDKPVAPQQHSHSSEPGVRRVFYADNSPDQPSPLGHEREDRKQHRKPVPRQEERQQKVPPARPSTAPKRPQPPLGHEQRRNDDRHSTPHPPSRIYPPAPQQRVYPKRERQPVPKGYVLDRRYHHDRYYPPRGHLIERLPHNHRVVHYRGLPYYFSGGIWFRPSGVHFIVVAPPFGLIVPVLPLYYTTIWIGGTPYYYADNVYYRRSMAGDGYVVVEPPSENFISNQVAPPDELFVYPKIGQSEQQQATDRFECHRWATDQTRFDPTQPPAYITSTEFTERRSAYLRAMRACLEGRGYSVR